MNRRGLFALVALAVSAVAVLFTRRQTMDEPEQIGPPPTPSPSPTPTPTPRPREVNEGD